MTQLGWSQRRHARDGCDSIVKHDALAEEDGEGSVLGASLALRAVFQGSSADQVRNGTYDVRTC
jgi:hypothetical protein